MSRRGLDSSNYNEIFQAKKPVHKHDRDIHQRHFAKGLGPRPHDPNYDIQDSVRK